MTVPATFNFAAHLFAVNAGRRRQDRLRRRPGHAHLRWARRARRAACAAALLGLGLRREERVLLLMHDGNDWPVSFLGCLYAGVVPVRGQHAAHRRRLRLHAARTAGPRRRSSRRRSRRSWRARWRRRRTRSGTSSSRGRRGRCRTAAAHSLEALLAAHAPLAEPAATGRDEAAFWLYSSGSTGRPKGTVHTHANLVLDGGALRAARCSASPSATSASRPPSSTSPTASATR